MSTHKTGSQKSRKIIYWMTTIITGAAFAAPGVGNLIRAPHIAGDMIHLGYPAYIMSILGVWKILGAITILLPGLPRLKEWAYAGMIFDLTGAAISRAVVGDTAPMIFIPLVIATVTLVSWSLRPGERTLKSKQENQYAN